MPQDQAYYDAEGKTEEARRKTASTPHHTDKRIPLNPTPPSLEPIPFRRVRRTFPFPIVVIH